MSEDLDEIPDIIDRAEPPKRKRRVVTKRSEPEPDASADDDSADTADGDEESEPVGKQKTMEDLDLRDMLPQQTIKPAENVKSLGDVIAKYNIGNSTEFKLQVWRTYPKIFPGGGKADGFYDTWDQPLTEELIQSEYGGGNFRIVVMGPHPTKPNTLKHYDSVSLNLAGTPKFDRQPKAVQQSQSASASAEMPSPMLMVGQENAKLSETAMKLAVDMAGHERLERIRVEERADAKAVTALAATQPAVDAANRRADDLIKAERERSDMERRFLQERYDESRRETQKLVERIESMETNRPSVAAELERILPFTQGPKGDGGEGNKVAERMMESVLDKHRVEMESMRSQQQQMIDNLNKQQESMVTSMRGSHQHEVATMREASLRELQSEREAGIRRQERADDQLKMEREERRRDQERHREVLDANERTWKERIEMQLASVNASWESRHQSVLGTHETRGLWLQQEIDRLKADLTDTKARMSDNSDPIAIVHKAKEIREAIGGPEHSSGSSGSSGGIGMGGVEDWKNLAVEGLTERAPQLLQVLGGLLSGQPQQPQQQYQVGQVVQTPQGEMVVIQTPQGLALTPKAALDQAQAQQQGRMLPPQGQQQGQRRRVMPDVEEVANGGGGGRRKRRGPIAATPNFADAGMYGEGPLPVRGRRPPWEGGGSDEDDQPQRQPQPQRQQPQPQPRRTSKESQPQPQQQRITRQMNPQERQGLSVIAKLVHESVMNADEPEEFAEKVLKEWAPEMLKRVIAGYSPDDIARGIAETQPNSAGATPAGQAFVRAAFAQIEKALA